MAGPPPDVIGRYALFEPFAAGGMATVHLGRLLGPIGFSRTVAIKRLHPGLADDPSFSTMMMDEARLSARVRHPNVVATLDVVSEGSELLVVMEYVHGDSLARLARKVHTQQQRLPIGVAVRIVAATLHGLHAAHESTTERGAPLNLVHRDVSPQNILVGFDGETRVADFGVAKATGRLQTTRKGEIKGKLSYMAPEQLRGEGVDRRADIYSASVVLWELLAGQRLFAQANEALTMAAILSRTSVVAPSHHVPGLPPALDAIVMKGLAARAEDRFATAEEMALELEEAVPLPHAHEVGGWAREIAGDWVESRERRLRDVESLTGVMKTATSPTQAASGARTSSRRRLAWGALVAFAALGSSGLIYAAVARTPSARANAATVSSASSPSVAASVTVEAAATKTAGSVPAVSVDSAAIPTSSAIVASSPPPTLRRPNAAPSHGRAKRAGGAKSQAHDCDPLFTVDSSGIKVPKPGCIQ